MAQPTHSDLHVNALLTNMSVAYLQDPANFIADQVYTPIPVEKQSNVYAEYPREYWLRSEMAERAPAAESAGSGWTVNTTAQYYCRPYALHKDITDQDYANADSVFRLDDDANSWLGQQVLLKKEILWVTNQFSSGLWTGSSGSTDIAGAASAPSTNQVLQWNDEASSPMDDVESGRLSMVEKTGKRPNALVIGPRVYRDLKSHPDILDRCKYGGGPGNPAMVNTRMLAELFEVERVLVPYATRNTAVEGATASYSLLYGKHALLCYVEPNPGLKKPSAGYTFTWNGLLGANALGGRISKWYNQDRRATRVETEICFDQKRVAADLGVFYRGIVA